MDLSPQTSLPNLQGDLAANPPITLLMGSYNGARFLDQQLASLEAQSHKNWQLWVSDDGSTDATLAILDRWKTRWHGQHTLRILQGPRRGTAANYMHMLCHAGLPRQICALCDQDDVWHPDKLRRALKHLAPLPAARPALYGAQSQHTDVALHPIGTSLHPRIAPSFQNALLQNIVSGHTAVMTPAALSLVRRVGAHPQIQFHDWWLYLLISAAGGQVIVDQAETLLYRQHAANAEGARQGFPAKWRRMRQVFDGTYGGWIRTHLALLDQIWPHLTPEARVLVKALRSPQTGIARVRNLHDAGLHRHSWAETKIVECAALFGRL